jgi:hypothetical protein
VKWTKVLLASNNKITKLQLSILITWLVFTIFAFGYFITDRLTSFDSNEKLKGVDYQRLSTFLAPYSAQIGNKAKHSILHFSTPSCDCQKYSHAHIQEINKLAAKYDFNIKNINIDEHDVIPSTPSIALLNESGEIVYFGPYGQGLACSQTAGYAQTILKNYLKGYSANIVIKEAKGCYCSV